AIRYRPSPGIRIRTGSFISFLSICKGVKVVLIRVIRGGFCYPERVYLKILGHPVFVNLNFHMPMIVDLSHPLIMLQGENGSGKSTLLLSIYHALRGDKVDGFIYRLEPAGVSPGKAFLFDAEQHNPRVQLELFKEQPEMLEFL